MLKGFSKIRPRVSAKFKNFDVRVKGRKALRRMIQKDSFLRQTVKSLFSKKGILAIGATTAVGIGITKIQEYIDANSGCFLFHNDDRICKVKSLSCCQNGPVQGIEFCKEETDELERVCDQFDEDDLSAQESCCLLCDCHGYGGCLPGETMECRRPTVAEAVSFFAQNAVSGISGWIWNLFSTWIVVVVVLLAIVVLAKNKYG
jgi:hypothetical protein